MRAHCAVRIRARERGVTLLVALVMLVVLTLFALTAIRTGNIGFKVVGNQQTQKLNEAAAQQAVEQVISNLANFDPRALPSTFVRTSPPKYAQRVCVNAAAGDDPVKIPAGGVPVSSLDLPLCGSGTPVDVEPVRCISTKRSQFDSLTQPMATYDNIWEIVAKATDSLTGATATYHQGVKIRMLSNNCPGLST